MRIQQAKNETSFKSVIPIVANDDYLQILSKNLFMTINPLRTYKLLNLSPSYNGNPKIDAFEKALDKGQEIGLLITGPDAIKHKNGERGWKTRESLLKRITHKAVFIGENSRKTIEKLKDKIIFGEYEK